MKTFLIIDGNSIANRSFYGISTSRLFVNDEGMYTNAVYGFLATYYMIEDMIKPDYVAVTFDVSKKTFRNELYTEYKGTRKGMPDELRPQMNVIKEVLDAMNITIIEKENYEADDVIGTVSKINEDNDIFTYILTGDKDSYQLISDKTNVIMPKTTMGKTEYTIYDITKLKEKYNIDPIQVIDIKSLMGDSADNIIGVPGIGEKTAYSLIEKYYSLDNIYKNIDVLDATNSVKLKLKDNYDTAHLSYKLATIVRDVDINYNLYDCIQKQVNKLKLFNIFKKLKFNKFLSKYNFDEINNFKELNDITDLTYIDNLDNITLNN
ncbi:MAG: 5'-3' exonuclease H3TH domain-containing protein, partial [Clostridia bacterium]